MKNQLFSSFWASKSPLSLASNLKKSHVDTFVCIKTVWSFVWSRQSLFHVPMDLNMCLTSYFEIFHALEIFWGSPKYQTVIYKITIFCAPPSWFLLWERFWEYYLKKSHSSNVFAIKNCLEHRQTSPLTSTDAQGPKQVPNNLFWCS